jgi:hypothetical protein
LGHEASLLRSFIQWSDAGSGHYTRPVLALDFELRFDLHPADENGGEGTVTIAMTGMQDYTEDRLPHVEGLPKPSGCFGCF